MPGAVFFSDNNTKLFKRIFKDGINHLQGKKSLSYPETKVLLNLGLKCFVILSSISLTFSHFKRRYEYSVANLMKYNSSYNTNVWIIPWLSNKNYMSMYSGQNLIYFVYHIIQYTYSIKLEIIFVYYIYI